MRCNVAKNQGIAYLYLYRSLVGVTLDGFTVLEEAENETTFKVKASGDIQGV